MPLLFYFPQCNLIIPSTFLAHIIVTSSLSIHSHLQVTNSFWKFRSFKAKSILKWLWSKPFLIPLQGSPGSGPHWLCLNHGRQARDCKQPWLYEVSRKVKVCLLGCGQKEGSLLDVYMPITQRPHSLIPPTATRESCLLSTGSSWSTPTRVMCVLCKEHVLWLQTTLGPTPLL